MESRSIRGELQEQLKEVTQLNNRMHDVMRQMLQKVDDLTTIESKDFVDTEKYCNREKRTEANELPTKQFAPRNSLLTDLYEIKHICTIYNIFVSAFVLLLIHTAVYDIRTTGSPNMGINTVRSAFGKFPVVLRVWSLMVIAAFGVHVAFCYWATRRPNFSPKSFARRVWDYSWLAALVVYQIVFIALPTKELLEEDLPVASSLIILMEQARLVMKTHGFVRTVAPRVLSYKPHADMPELKLPDFSKYLYFMFAPTLIYQDSYPRALKIRWDKVLSNATEVLAVIFLLGIVYERWIFPTFKDFGTKRVEWGMLVLNVLSSILSGTILFCCGFYCLLHSWMNAFAELLRFADRMFYKDWWNSSNYASYYRTWNIVVHDWLYAYIYKDTYEIVTARNKKLSVYAVFLISAIFHEYILCFTFRFFYPALLIAFGTTGLSAMIMLKTAGTGILWFSLYLGNGILVSLYCMEYFARANCPPVRDDFLDLFVPRSWACIFN